MERQLSFDAAPVSFIILFLTIAASLYAFYGKKNVYESWALRPYLLIRKKLWHTVITSGFIHADYLHLLFNMLTFYYFAFALEETLAIVAGNKLAGSLYFAVIYFGSMVLADVSTILKNRDNPGYSSLGASGAISGVVFSFILFYPDAKMGFFLLPPIIPAPIFGLLYMLYCYYAARNMRDRINHEAHLWGAVAGIAITLLLAPEALKYFIEAI